MEQGFQITYISKTTLYTQRINNLKRNKKIKNNYKKESSKTIM